jgi:hypothetical protein
MTNMNRTVVFLHEGRACVAELKDGRARVSSLVAWLSAHPGRGALRSLALEPLPPSLPRASARRSGRVRAGLGSMLGRLLGGRASPDPQSGARAG